MSTDKTDPSQASGQAGGDKAPSMKDRLLAQRQAEAKTPAAGTPAPRPASDPKLAASAARPANPTKPAAAAAPVAKPAVTPTPRPVGRPGLAQARGADAEEKASMRKASSRSAGLSPDVQREVELLKKRDSKVMTYVWIACGVLTLVAVAVLANTLISRQKEEAAVQLGIDTRNNFLAEMQKFDPLKEADAIALIKLSDQEDKKPLWRKGSSIEVAIVTMRQKAQRTIDNVTERREMTDRLAQVEASAGNADTLSMDDIKSKRRTITDLVDKSQSTMDDDYKTRLAVVKDTFDKAYLKKLLSDARAKGQTREALTAFTLAEIEIRNSLDSALRIKNAEERKKWYQDLYRQLLTDSDATATAVFTQTVIDAEPWKDALSSELEKNWLKTDNLTGFRLDSGVLQVVGPKAGSGHLAAISIGDKEQLKDIVAHVEFTVVKGNVRFYYRVYNRADNSPYFDVKTIGAGADFKPGQSYTMDTKVIGSVMSIKFPGTELPAPEEQIPASKQRFGSIDIELSEDSEIKFTSFKYKDLRSNKKP